MSESIESTNQLEEKHSSTSTGETTATDGIPISDTASVKSLGGSSIVSSRSTKPSGIKPPSTVSSSSSRIGRLCQSHGTPKAALPPMEQKSDPSINKSKEMRRQSEEYSRSHLADVSEECEADLITDRCNSRNTKSPESYYSSSKAHSIDRKTSNGSMNSDLYWEATGRRRSSDHGVVLTTDTDSFIIGQRVWVGGARPGQIAFIGETHFAPGEWAGIVLDDANGKNDGCVSGKRYFQCEPKRGIFSRLTRLTREPILGATSSDTTFDTSLRSYTSPVRSGTVSPTASSIKTNGNGRASSNKNLAVGDRVIVSSGMGSRPGMLKYIGDTKFSTGIWCGVQLDEPSGKNDGSVDGVRYFECLPHYGVFVPIAKVSLSPSARKLSRLSRAGSKESLNSIGTMGSIASTATSRLRMSAQKLSAAKPKIVTQQKHSYSLQEILREKQNHIEQLLNERDLNREDYESQTIQFQNTIKELQNEVVQLKKRLTDEKLKAEDLQFSIDEVTFCGDELNAQSQEYEETINNLRKEIESLKSVKVAGETQTDSNSELSELKSSLQNKCNELDIANKENVALNEQINQLNSKIGELRFNSASNACELSEIETELQDEIKFLSDENAELKNALNDASIAKEKEYLSMKEIEVALKEEILQLQSDLSLKTKSLEEASKKSVQEKEVIIHTLQSEIDILKKAGSAECSDRDKTINTLKEQCEIRSKEVTELKSTAEEQSKEINELKKCKGELEISINKVSEDYSHLNELKSELEGKLGDLTKNFEVKSMELQTTSLKSEELSKKCSELNEVITSKSKEMEKLKVLYSRDVEGVVAELNQQISTLSCNLENERKLKTEIEEKFNNSEKQLIELRTEHEKLLANHSKQTEECNSLHKDVDHYKTCVTENVSTIEELTKKLEDYSQSGDSKDVEINRLRTELELALSAKSALETKLEEIGKELIIVKEDMVNQEKTLQSTLERKMNDANEEKTKLQDTIENLGSEISTLKTKLNELSNENTELQTTKLKMEQQSTELKEDIDKKTSELTKSFDIQKNLEGEIRDLNQNFQKATNEVDILKAKYEESQLKISELDELKSKKQVECSDLERKIEVLDQKVVMLNEQKTGLQTEIESLRSSTHDSSSEASRLSEELSKKQKDYEELLDTTNTNRLNMEKQIQELTQSLTSRQSQLDDLKNEIENIKSEKINRENQLNMELARMKDDYESQKQQLHNENEALKNSFKEERTKLMGQLSEKLDHSTKLKDEMDQGISRLQARVKELEGLLDSTKMASKSKEEEWMGKMNELYQKELNLVRQMEALRVAEETSQNTIQELKEVVDQTNNALQEKLYQGKSYESSLRQEIQEITKAKANIEGEYHSLQLKLKDNEQQIEHYIALENSLISKIDELNGLKIAGDKQIAELTEKFKVMEEEQIDLVNKLDEKKIRIENLVKNEQLLVETKEKLESDTAAKENEWITNCNELSQAITQYETIIESLKKEVQDLTSIKSDLEEKTERLMSTENLSEELKHEVQSKAGELQKKNDEIKDLQNKVKELELTITNSDDKLNKLVSEHETELTNMNTELELFRQQMIKIEETLKQKEEEYKTIIKQKELLVEKESLNVGLRDQKVKELEDKLLENEQKIRLLNEQLHIKEEELKTLLKNKHAMDSRSYEFEKLQKEFEKLEEEKKAEIEALTKKYIGLEKLIKDQTESLNKLDRLSTKEKQLHDEKKILEQKEKDLIEQNDCLKKELNQLKTISENTSKLVAKTTSTTSIMEPNDNKSAEISFLNSIIADMQKKNEALSSKIQVLESGPSDLFKNGVFEIPFKRKPAPRLFCDICDIFDAHETEDCPIQSSDSPPESLVNPLEKDTSDGIKERKIPPPRKYCTSCEVFGHEEGECIDDETY